MPSRMIHYCIGNEIAKAISLNSSLFTIGNLSPDAHDGSYYGVVSSHYKTAYKPGIDKYPVVDLGTFKIKYLTKTYDDFILGYYCHLITDDLWSKSVYFECLQCDEVERNIRVEECYHDYYTLNKILIEKFNLNKVILHVPKQIHIDEITLVNLQRIVEEFYNDFKINNDNEVLLILTIHFIQHFIKNTVEECIKEILCLIEREQYVPCL